MTLYTCLCSGNFRWWVISAFTTRSNSFTHDLIYEATLSGIPAPIRTLLHGRVAGWLENANANPANTARHYLAAAEEAKAAPFLFQAAKRARETFLYTDAIQLLEQAFTLAKRYGLKNLAFDSLFNLAEVLSLTNQGNSMHRRLKRYCRGLVPLCKKLRLIVSIQTY
jgi:predicted ATPase